MLAELKLHNKSYSVDLNKPLDISILLKNGKENPNCYYANDVKFTTIRSGNFIGSVEEGGSVNYQEVLITPHGNGTHTECYGHLSAKHEATINQTLQNFHHLAEVMTLNVQELDNGDRIVSYSEFVNKRKFETEAVIIRTIPNKTSKKTLNYSGSNPPYIDFKIAELLFKTNVKHLLIDLPSLDKEVDGGMLLAHKAFWGLPDSIRKECTVTELIYVDNKVLDGLYLLNLQVLNMEIDASPSRPILFKLEPI
jgi:arylformamidase